MGSAGLFLLGLCRKQMMAKQRMKNEKCGPLVVWATAAGPGCWRCILGRTLHPPQARGSSAYQATEPRGLRSRFFFSCILSQCYHSPLCLFFTKIVKLLIKSSLFETTKCTTVIENANVQKRVTWKGKLLSPCKPRAADGIRDLHAEQGVCRQRRAPALPPSSEGPGAAAWRPRRSATSSGRRGHRRCSPHGAVARTK